MELDMKDINLDMSLNRKSSKKVAGFYIIYKIYINFPFWMIAISLILVSRDCLRFNGFI